MAQPHRRERWPDQGWHETGPVFADPTGHRRRLMRVLGAAASVFLIGALVIAGVGLFGGPDTPFSVFGAPAGNGGGQQASHGRKDPAPGTSSSAPAARSAKPSASAD
ncbi:MAG TPA: hypothetical protein VJT16_24175, partial [Streptosporangiaceae bacterium]|nr:hypothetical protein [Streptosporangiaceae bacterium]